MKVAGFIQIKVDRTVSGNVRGLTLGPVTQRFPRALYGDTIVAKLELDVSPELLRPTVLEGAVPPGAATIVLEVPENPS